MSDGSVADRAAAIQSRRSWTLLWLGLFVPGSAQVAAGNRRLGLWAVRLWILLWLGLAGLAVVAVVRRSLLVTLVTNVTALWVVFGVVVGIGTAWVLLIWDTWRVGHPRALTPGRRVVFTLFTALLAAAVGGGTFLVANAVRAQIGLVSQVFQGGGSSLPEVGRYNVLLLGGDAGAGREGLRPDSITLASVDAKTGRTLLIGLPRNLEDVPFPESSPLHSLYPNGYTCADHSCLLNAIYTLAMEHADLYPGVANPGVQATAEAVGEITGLKINYFALIDLRGFIDLIDAVGGIDLDVNRAVPIGGETSPISGYIGPGQNLHLDGYHALWFARSRTGSSDYERMQRQKCVINAMLNQLDPLTVATRFTALMGATGKIVETDVPPADVSGLVELALRARRLPIASLSLTPPLVHPGSPNWATVRAAVAERVAASEALDAATATAARPTATASAAAARPTATATSENEISDLSEVCAAR